jgi:hypothetical protein
MISALFVWWFMGSTPEWQLLISFYGDDALQKCEFAGKQLALGYKCVKIN